MQPPTLETSRLVLEPLSACHSSGMFELWSAAEVCEHSGRVMDWAQSYGAEQVAAYVDRGNFRSARLVKRLGFSKTGEVRDEAECYLLASVAS